jgi:predicted DNA binding CopG/RHH family protein
MFEEENKKFLELFPPSNITDIEISEENCQRLKGLHEMQQFLDKAKNFLQQRFSEYLDQK